MSPEIQDVPPLRAEHISPADREKAQKDIQYNRSDKGSFTGFFRHVKKLSYYPKTVIDVGVATGTHGLYTSFRNAHFVMVEPMKEFVPAMEEHKKVYDADFVVAAAGAADGEIEISLLSKFSQSTTADQKTEDDSDHQGATRVVRMVALDSLIETHGIVTPLILKLDIQGAELTALDGAPRILEMADIVLLETSLFRFHRQTPELHEVVVYMKERGFVVYDIVGGSLRTHDNALAQVDLIFVKENGFFRQTHRWG